MGRASLRTCPGVFQRKCRLPRDPPQKQSQIKHIFPPTQQQIVCSVDPRFLRLTPYDDLIYSTFRQDFPTYNVARLADDELKSDDAKIRWRTFCDKFNKLEDFSFGTIIRTDASGSFHPENTTLVIRLQFWALEIARNREGHNDGLRQNFRDAQVTEAEQQHPDAVAQQSLST